MAGVLALLSRRKLQSKLRSDLLVALPASQLLQQSLHGTPQAELFTVTGQRPRQNQQRYLLIAA